MLKEMTLLVIVLWGSQGRPTQTPQEEEFERLSEIYCTAEKLLRDYKSDDSKSLPSEVRPTLESVFSQPGCNFTKPAGGCQMLPAFQALFLWLKSNYPQAELLKSVRNSFMLLINLQDSHLIRSCSEGASDKAPQITCPKYSSDQPELENKFHYIFELYRNHTHNLWRSKLTEKQREMQLTCVKSED